MRLSNADTAKRALVTLLAAQTQTAEPLDGVQVEYVDPAQDTGRECVYLGVTRSLRSWDQDFPTEDAAFPVYVQVVDPADSPETTEQRAYVIGQVICDVMATNKFPAGAGSWWQVVATEAVSSRSADESKTLLSLQVRVVSHL
jgi:hypothetical protein